MLWSTAQAQSLNLGVCAESGLNKLVEATKKRKGYSVSATARMLYPEAAQGLAGRPIDRLLHDAWRFHHL